MAITAQIIKSGVLVPSRGAGSENIDYIGPGMQVWVKQA